MSQRYTIPTYTTGSGNPVTCPFATERIGTNGPLLLQDSHLIEVLASFNREKIPERIVHAKGTGAYGVFEVTHDVSQYTCAQFLQPNTSSKVFVRFSTVGGEKGSADTARDPRGFAVRFYSEEGNCDIVGNNTPIFFLRDPVKFSPFIHTQKRNPKTGLKDPNAHWTYVVEHQEALHQYFLLHSDRGTPASYREMHGYGSHTYKLVQNDGQFVYVKFHFRSDLGFKTLSDEEATKLSGEDPDHHRRDLYENIEKGNFPSWTLCIQTMTPEQAEKAPFSIFDLTKVWPHADYPLQKVGKLTLNEVPKNFYAEVEQAALSPSNMVPGVAPSADPVLQSRLFSYPDAQRYRLGVNYRQIPVNCPLHEFNPLLRDGAMRVDGNLGDYPTYLPSSVPIHYKVVPGMEHHERWVGTVTRFHWEASIEQGDFVQIQSLWNVFAKTNQQKSFVGNVSGHLKNADPAIQDRVFDLFSKVAPELGKWIREETLKLSPREPRKL